ncbi:stress responsive A/B barrel domain protein [Lophiotrema nucula]|uniref:Stress responsive A/B barrel domain protein n=1 Tax=Lophiotrema nucula TaxID=690887 RepID=A0A6A5ZN00_9PLEO|nr:stress responsive A/B barrel domain protein [Lophiotrema nucula]
MGGVTHIVQVSFKSDVSADVIQETCDRMLGLRESCLHPTTQKPYIRASKGGKDCSVEGMQNGFTHVFVVEFDSVEDRDYYALKDPKHLEFGAFIGTVVSQVQVMDFMSNVFGLAVN